MKKIFTSLALLLFIHSILLAQAGILDPTFATNGLFKLDNGGQDAGADVVTQPDGKILTLFSGDFGSGFDFGVVRLNFNGSIDSTFAVNGIFHFDNPLGSDLSYHLELLNDGSMLLAGSYAPEPINPEWMMIKLSAEGVRDSTFGVDGVSIFQVDISEDYIRSLAIADDGKIYAGGFSYEPGFSFRRLVVGRFNPDGTIDSSYGNNGIFIWKDNSTSNYLSSIHLNDDGSIYVGGTTRPSSSNRPTVFKILPEGTGLDTSFGTNGESLAPVEGRAGRMALHPNGNILLSSPTTIGNGVDLAVIAFNTDGTLNETFGVDGIFSVDAHPADYGLDVTVQSDGKILVSGEANEGFSGSHLMSARCDEDGVLDTSWGVEGLQVHEMANSGIGWARAIHFDTLNGSVYIAGTASFTGTLNDVVVMRYYNLVDADMDGFYLGYGDCNDSNANINPDVIEVVYNGLDDDCDPETPDDDIDGDGFLLADDCNDNDPGINPDAVEILDNGIDEDCSGADLTDIEEIELAHQYQIFPNPTSDFIHLTFDENAPLPHTIFVSDYTGKQIQTLNQDFSQRNITINLQNIPTGVYLLNIQTQEGVVIKKIVKN